MTNTQGTLPYQDQSLDSHNRAKDLLARMTLDEKAGQVFHSMIMPLDDLTARPPPSIELLSANEFVVDEHLTHFNLIGPVNDPKATATWHNAVQQLVLDKTRLGIPITISTDPRNHFTENVGTSFTASAMSQWPEPLGLAALRDPALVEKFADIARREYLALGFRCALHPQIDLATEPRWARINATFGEDADLTGDLVEAYIRGFQTPTFGRNSVSTMAKHFPGGGPQGNNGEDSHFEYGPDQEYPAGMFEHHLKPFERAIKAGARQMMPYYSKPVGTEYEEVAFAFNKDIINGILRQRLKFDGIVCTDWGVITDAKILGQTMPARAWGTESLSGVERVVKVLNAGCDQFGGEYRTDLVIEAVKCGMIPKARLDKSVLLLLKEKFELGLFDDKRFVDVEKAGDIVGASEFRLLGLDAQRKSCTLLVNKNNTLPLGVECLNKRKFYIEGLDAEVARSRGMIIVDKPSEAEIAVLRLRAPFENRSGGFEQFFHAGSLDFAQSDIDHHKELFRTVPQVIVDVYLDRPVILTHLAEEADVLIVNFGIAADALLDVLLGKVAAKDETVGPEGRLPFDLPRSMEAVRNSACDKPFGTADPVFRFGDGLRYG